MRTFEEYLRDAAKYGSLGKGALHWQAKQDSCEESILIERMRSRLDVMRESAKAGLSPTLRSVSGMVGGQAALMNVPEEIGRFGLLGKAGAYALSIAEYNACMGKIVAAPTAGSCGILPGALLGVTVRSSVRSIDCMTIRRSWYPSSRRRRMSRVRFSLA